MKKSILMKDIERNIDYLMPEKDRLFGFFEDEQNKNKRVENSHVKI